jgi:hypothetical protein
MGWDEEHFKESFSVMRDAGVWNVAGDYASLDDMFSQKLFRSKAGAALHKGTMFFTEGERFVRLNAFNTAYLEWKSVNKGAKLVGNQREIAKVLTRYDDLALNMTSKSTAAFQKGVFSLPSQFMTYNIHLSEQMLGKRLTPVERARALTTYSALYGLPIGMSAAVPLWPWGADIKQAAMDRGIDINNGAMDLLMNGIMGNAVELATGKETNISERYGPNSLSLFKDAISGNKTAWELMSGPSGQVTGETLKGIFSLSAPLVSAVMAGDPSSNDSYPLLADDFVQRMRVISTVNNAVKFYVAANHNKFMSKNEVFQTDADVYDGVMTGILGVDPRSISDLQLQRESMKDVKAFKLQKSFDVEKNIKRAMENYEDPEAFNRYMRAAKMDSIDGGFTPQEYQSSMKRAFDGIRTSQVEKVNKLWINKTPAGLQWKNKALEESK